MTAALGDRIKRLRLARDMTLKQVGDRAGVSATHLSEIERGKTSPTVGALVRIAAALGEEASRLVDEAAAPALAVVRADERRELSERGALLSVLSGPVVPADLTVVEIAVPAGAPVPRPGARGEEFVLVREGAVEVVLAQGARLLRDGDAAHFRAEDCLSIHNRGDRPARLLWVGSPAAAL
jgi:transcriptional regulator with XRE-family HTH domain